MTKQTLESMIAVGEGPELEAAIAATVTEIADYIRDFLKAPDRAEAHANDLFWNAVEMGRVHGDSISAEVRSIYTTDGNPLAFTI